MAIVIAGAGGFAKEVFQYSCDLGTPDWAVRGFIARGRLSPELEGVAPMLGDIPEFRPEQEDELLIAIGDGRARLKIAETLKTVGVRWRTLIHPLAYVASTAEIGPGCIIAPFAFVGPHAKLDAHVVLNTYASVGHDSVVGHGATLSPYACINGSARLAEGVFMGSHALVAPGVHVEAISKVAAGSVVARDAPRGSLLIGNPAKGRVMFR